MLLRRRLALRLGLRLGRSLPRGRQFHRLNRVRLPPPWLPSPTRGAAAEPLTADLSRLHITVSRRFLEKLQAARAALSHSRPSLRAEDILEAGLDLVLKRDAKRKGLVQKPRKENPRQENPRQEN